MGLLTLQVLAAIALVLTAVAYGRFARTQRPAIPPDRTYLDAISYRAATVGLPDQCEAAKTFAENAAALSQSYREAETALDGKIGTILGFVGGGTSVLALLTGTDKIARPALSPLLIVAVAALAIVLYCALEGLRPQTRNNVNVAEQCDLVLLRSMSGNSRMHALMGWEYLEATRLTVPIVVAKAEWLKRCYRAFAVGVMALVVNAALPTEHPTQPHTVSVPLACTSSTGRMANCTLDLTEVPK